MTDGPVEPELIADRQVSELRRRQFTSAVYVLVAAVSFVVVEPVLGTRTGALWVLSVAAILVIRWGSMAFLVRRGASSESQLRAYAVGASASGLAWGALPVLLHQTAGVVEFAFAGFVIAGVTAGGLLALSWHRPAYFGYVLGSTVPLAIVLFLQGSVLFVAMGGLVALYALVLIGTSTSFGRQLRESLRLQNALEQERSDLESARAELRLAADHKWQTLAYLSHHLRTPMNAVIGFSDLMAQEAMGPLGHPKYRDYVQNIQISGTEALRAVSAILDVAEVETGTMTLALADQDLAAITAECVAEQSTFADSRGVRLRCLTPAQPAPVQADPKRLRQIFDGLISNAVRFTPKGGAVVVSIVRDGADWWTVQVKDSGMGMPSERVDEAFIPFVRLDNPLTQEFDGIGVSLTLARRLTMLHGGEFVLQTDPGHGTTVAVRLPAVRRSTAVPAAGAA